ncbi:MAG: TonB-dependent receptor [Polyangiaceae bacterium]
MVGSSQSIAKVQSRSVVAWRLGVAFGIATLGASEWAHGATTNADAGATTNTDAGATTNTDAGATTNTDAGAATNTDAGAATNTDAGAATNTESHVEVTVQGHACDTRAGTRDENVASSVVGRPRLQAPGLQAQEVLRSQPGVVITETGGFGSEATASMRGASPMDTPVYLAGLRLNDDVIGAADLSMIPLHLIERVEIYRGNAPMDADRLGPAGAIFFEPRLPRGTTYGAGYFGGSWGASRTWGYGGTKQGPVRILLGLSAERASNRYPFVNDNGMLLSDAPRTTEQRRNADERTIDGWLLGRGELGRHFTLDLMMNGAWREAGVMRLALLQSREARKTTSRRLVQLKLKGPLDEAQSAVLTARTALVEGGVVLDDPLRELSIETDHSRIVDRRLEQTMALDVSSIERLRLRPVVDLARETIERTPSDVELSGTARQSIRLGTQAEYDVTSWLLGHALLNLECHHTGARERGYCDERLPTGRFGITLRVLGARLYGSAGRYLRVPTLGELYGLSGTVQGNRRLEPETGSTYDLGVRYSAAVGRTLREVYLDVFSYVRNADELVAYARTGQGFVRPYNVNAARVMGVESLLGAHLGEMVSAEFVATITDPRDVSAERQTKNDLLPYRSRLIAAPRLRADYRAAHGKNPSSAGGQLSSVYQSSRYADPAGLAVIGEQLTWDLEAYLGLFADGLTLRGRVSDLFDARRTDVVGYPLPGRSIYLGIEANH